MITLNALNGEATVEIASREEAEHIKSILKAYGIKLDVKESGEK